MPPAQLPAELLGKIAHARTLEHRPHTQRFTSPATLAQTLKNRAQTDGAAPFLTYLADDGRERRYSYADFYEQVRCLAAMFQLRANIARGDRIATAMHNHDQTILAYFAAWHLGATVVPLNMGEDDKRLAYILRHANVRALVALPEHAERMRPLWKDAKLDHFFLAGPESAAKPWEYSIDAHLMTSDAGFADSPADLSPDDEALIVYTSGTTGVPKGVVLTQYNLLADAHAIAAWHGFDAGTKMMCVLPVHHVNGLEVTHVTPLFCGASVTLMRKFSASHFFETVRAHGIHVVSMVPTLLQFLLEAHPDGADTGALRYVICGAGPLTVDLAQRFEERFKIPIVHGYGLSETTCYSCFVPLVEGHANPGSKHVESWDAHRRWMRDFGYPSIGAAIETNAMAIHNDAGECVKDGEKGEIVVRGHNVMPGYYDNLKANEGAFSHGWFRSGDEGFYKTASDGTPYFFICGRFKELIIRGGVKISPLEIDEVINSVPGVKAGMAVGFECTTYGEEVGAYVVPDPATAGGAPDTERILAACRAKLPFWMSPKVVVFGDTFPVTSTGKYQRNQLRALFAAHKDTQFRQP
jgi:acyl-CoA synthetase (AMP-forming)/AMP-acid ligase II